MKRGMKLYVIEWQKKTGTQYDHGVCYDRETAIERAEIGIQGDIISARVFEATVGKCVSDDCFFVPCKELKKPENETA